MKVQYKVNPRTIIEAEGETAADVFAKLSALAQVFAHGEKCGSCGSAGVIPQVREPQGFKYFEFMCVGCGCRFPLGQLKEPKGGLFPKHKNDDGSVKPHGGWEKYTADQALER